MRRQLQFGLGTLFVVVTIVVIWLARTTNDARSKTVAIAEVEVDGHIQFREDRVIPDWLRKAIGDEYFSNEKSVGLGIHSSTNDQQLEHLSALTKLESLEVTNASAVTDDGLVHLEKLSGLTRLFLRGSQVQGPGLVHLSTVPKLTYVCLDNSPVNDVGLKHMGEMRNLETAHLTSTRITDRGTSYLVRASSLKQLTLSYTSITDATLDTLADLKGLKWLDVSGTKVTSAGVERFKDALPDCVVQHSFGLGQTAINEPLFPEGSSPDASEVNAKLKELEIDGDAACDSANSGRPIVSLRISSSTLSDAVVLSLLDGMPHLESLELSFCNVGDAVIAGLAGKPIRRLSLPGTNISDDCMSNIAGLEELRELDISQTAVTDIGLKHLYQSKKLEPIIAVACAASYAGISELNEALRERIRETGSGGTNRNGKP